MVTSRAFTDLLTTSEQNIYRAELPSSCVGSRPIRPWIHVRYPRQRTATGHELATSGRPSSDTVGTLIPQSATPTDREKTRLKKGAEPAVLKDPCAVHSNCQRFSVGDLAEKEPPTRQMYRASTSMLERVRSTMRRHRGGAAGSTTAKAFVDWGGTVLFHQPGKVETQAVAGSEKRKSNAGNSPSAIRPARRKEECKDMAEACAGALVSAAHGADTSASHAYEARTLLHKAIVVRESNGLKFTHVNAETHLSLACVLRDLGVNAEADMHIRAAQDIRAFIKVGPATSSSTWFSYLWRGSPRRA